MKGDFAILAAVAGGGAVGAVTRFLATLAMRHYVSDTFPWGTLIVNVGGCFLLGYFVGLPATHSATPPTAWQRGVTAGFLGALTTFSTFGVETLYLSHQRGAAWAALNLLSNLLLGLLAAWAGMQCR